MLLKDRQPGPLHFPPVTPEGKKLREAFRKETPDLDLDFKAIELRLLEQMKNVSR